MTVLSKVTNSIKGMACGVMVWFLILGFLRFIQSVQLFGPLWGPLKVLVLFLGPPVLYPLLIWVVFRYQLPPLSSHYILKNWPLWIPGLLVACLPSLDILFLGKRLLRLILG